MPAPLTAETHAAKAGCEVSRLARLPPAVDRILALSRHQGSSARHVASACGAEAGISSRILAVVNSAALGCRQPVPDLLQAAVILGMNRIRNLALAAHLLDSLESTGAPLGTERYWRHAFAVAQTARSLGQTARSRRTEDMYLAGLLHDVGVVILARSLGEAYEPILAEASEAGADLEAMERTRLGATHAQVGFELASRWPVDGAVTGAILHHHAAPGDLPASLGNDEREVIAAVQIAEMVCRHHGWGLVVEQRPLPDRVQLPAWIPVSPEELRSGFAACTLQSEEARRLLARR